MNFVLLLTIGLLGFPLATLAAPPEPGTRMPACTSAYSSDHCCGMLFRGRTLESSEAKKNDFRPYGLDFVCILYKSENPEIAIASTDPRDLVIDRSAGPFSLNCRNFKYRNTRWVDSEFGARRSLMKGFCEDGEERPTEEQTKIVKPGKSECDNTKFVITPDGKKNHIAIRLSPLMPEGSSSTQLANLLKNVVLSWSKFSGELLKSTTDKELLELPEYLPAGIYRACATAPMGKISIKMYLENIESY